MQIMMFSLIPPYLLSYLDVHVWIQRDTGHHDGEHERGRELEEDPHYHCPHFCDRKD